MCIPPADPIDEPPADGVDLGGTLGTYHTGYYLSDRGKDTHLGLYGTDAQALVPFPYPLGLMAVGIVMVARRRYRTRPARLSRGTWDRFPISLAAFAAFFFLATLPAVVPALAFGWAASILLAGGIAWGLAEMLVGATWGGPMKHAFAGIMHLAFHPRPERFAGHDAISSGLKRVDMEEPKLGVETPSDMPWNRLLSFDACVQCGRCEARPMPRASR